MKYQRYLSFDLDTRDKQFKIQYYGEIRKFFVKLGFSPLKDSNYLSGKKLDDRQVRKINRQFAKEFPNVVDSLTKFDWTVFRPDLVNHAVNDLKDLKQREESKIKIKEKYYDIERSK
jgi:virulence-associated protein VapD